MTTEQQSISITVRPINIVAQVADIGGVEYRLNSQPQTRFAVVIEAGEQIAVEAVFDTEAATVEAAQALEQLLRGAEGPRLATRDGKTLR